jgi:hypothetical protein
LLVFIHSGYVSGNVLNKAVVLCIFQRGCKRLSNLVQVIKVNFLHKYKLCFEFILLKSTRNAKVSKGRNKDFAAKGQLNSQLNEIEKPQVIENQFKPLSFRMLAHSYL